MCRAKTDINNPGGRRCPAHSRERVMRINDRLEALEIELSEGTTEFERTLNEQIQESANSYLLKLHEEKRNLLRERKAVQESADMSIVGIENIRKEAESTVDKDKKAELLAKADELEKKLNKEKEDRKQAFLNQSALLSVMEKANVPDSEQQALLESIKSDTGSSTLRSWNQYQERLKKQKVKLNALRAESKALNTSATNEMSKIWADTTMTNEEKNKAISLAEKKWSQKVVERKIAKQKTLINETLWNKFQTLDGLNGINDEVDDKVAEDEALIKEATDRGDWKSANAIRLELTEYQGQMASRRKAIMNARNVRLSDRKVRESIKPRIKEIMKDAGASDEQIQTALHAYAEPEGYVSAQKTDHWDRKVTALMHLTPDEYKALADADMDSMVQKATTIPSLPKGKTLQDVHGEFVRHHDGGGHRQTTVQGVTRKVKARLSVKQSQLAIIDSYANALGVSRSAYLRGQISTGNPFALLNDRSSKNRNAMAHKATDFIQGRSVKMREKLENAGGSYWSRGNHERIYFNEQESYEVAGGGISYYKNSGRVSSAHIPGLNRISNRKSYATSYYDLKTEKFVVEASDPSVKEAMENAFKKLVE